MREICIVSLYGTRGSSKHEHVLEGSDEHVLEGSDYKVESSLDREETTTVPIFTFLRHGALLGMILIYWDYFSQTYTFILLKVTYSFHVYIACPTTMPAYLTKYYIILCSLFTFKSGVELFPLWMWSWTWRNGVNNYSSKA